MHMISLENVCYGANDREVLSDVSFSINDGDKIGLVGPNGIGKTTLLKLINNDLVPTSGRILRGDEEVGVLPQDLRGWLDHSVYEFIEEVTGVKSAREQFDEQCNRLSQNANNNTLLLYADALERYDKLEVATFDGNLEKALKRADIASVDTNKEIGDLSGGQRTRVALAAVFASRYDVVLLDEPTNNLDERGVVVLEKFIEGSNASFLIVSHDRRFLKNATSRIIEIVGGDKGIRQYGLGYDEYVEARARDRQAVLDRHDQYEKEKKRLERAAKEARIKANSAGSNKSSSDGDKLTAHFRREKAAKGLAGAASGIGSRLGKLEEPERPEDDLMLSFSFKEKMRKKMTLLSVTDLQINHGDNNSIGPVSIRIASGDKVLLTGQNGAGKTSIINGIVNREHVESGEVYISEDAGIIYVDQNQTLPISDGSALDNLLNMAPALELHEAINLLVRFGINKDILRTVHAEHLSGGERAKVILAGIAANNTGLLILDEPTNNLDIPTVEALELALKNYNGGLLMVSHDREFVHNVQPNSIIEL